MNTSKTASTAQYLFRRRKQLYDRFLRVDHAGELGADRIYWGQMCVLRKDQKHAPVIQEMWNQEKGHLAHFEKQILKHRTRKSFLEPFWSIGGFALGAGKFNFPVQRTITKHLYTYLKFN